MNTKVCSRCQLGKPTSEFSRKHDTRDGFQSRCKTCSRDIQWYIRYGLTFEDYSRLLEEQGGTCAICHGPEPRYKHFPIDHDHATGKVRGLLCSNCNPMIGYAGDNPEVLMSAIQYLQRKA